MMVYTQQTELHYTRNYFLGLITVQESQNRHALSASVTRLNLGKGQKEYEIDFLKIFYYPSIQKVVLMNKKKNKITSKFN